MAVAPTARHTGSMVAHTAFPADGFTARWQTWDGSGDETLSLRWENEAWTVSGEVSRERVHYVLRLSPLWQVRQFLLFRDLDDPDLWLATDGRGRWGEVNGAHRTDLDGSHDIELDCTPFTTTLPLRRLPLDVGDEMELAVLLIDVETLAVRPVRQRYRRLEERRWLRDRLSAGEVVDTIEFGVDDYGLVLDLPGRYRRR